MFENVTKWIVLLASVSTLIACDEDKATGDSHAGVDCNESNNPNCYTTYPDNSPISDDYDYESYGDGDVVTFQWDQTLAWFLQSDAHKYGYDRDPFSNLEDYVERGKDVYMSVLKGEMAVVKVIVDPESKKEYHLHKINEEKEILQKDIVVGTDVCIDENCEKEYSLPVGDYAVYYGDVDKKRYLHIIEYTNKKNDVYFMQLGDEYGNTCNIGNDNGCYTNEIVQDNYNRVMSQVVTTGNFTEIKPSSIGLETVGSDDILVVDLTKEREVTDESTNCPIVSEFYNKFLESEEFGYGKEEKEYLAAYDKYIDSKEKYENDELDLADYNYAVTAYNNAGSAYNTAREDSWTEHLVLGINEMRIRWKFSLEKGEIILNNYNAFERVCQVDQDACKSNILSMTLESDDCGDKDVPVKLSVASRNGNNFVPKISGFGLKEKCNYTIYADVYPFIPDDPNSAQVTIQNYKSKTDHSIIGGMVWGSHLNGAASLNTIVHETGHSFGLTDLYKDPADPSNAPERYSYFAFNESNIMAYSVPSGDRLRYRPLFVVNTGTNDRISIGDGWYATENQWDCVRSNRDCYKR